ncbi:MAG: CRISPR-associated protein Cas4 [Phycisphaerae bacterium]|jgi:CRISPR-associated exonuclease Cas4
MYAESDYILISGLQHYQFCPRQWALIHLELIWDENQLTTEGKLMHENAHREKTVRQGDVIIARGLRLACAEHGITGQADVVEFHLDCDSDPQYTLELSGYRGRWRPLPVEYKHGKPKKDSCDEVQLCAQALCLEEMLKVSISEGAFFYGQPRRRFTVALNDKLREKTINLIQTVRNACEDGITPKAKYCRKCDKCSLIEQCMPEVTGVKKRVERYLQKAWEIEE